MKDHRSSAVQLTELEQKLVSEIGALATMSLWKHVLKAGPGILVLVGMSTFFYWVPSRIDAMGLRLCERRGSNWFPLAPTPDVYWVEQHFLTMGAVFAFAAFITTCMVWAHIFRYRQLHQILSKAGVVTRGS
jgi:hypothetical protein